VPHVSGIHSTAKGAATDPIDAINQEPWIDAEHPAEQAEHDDGADAHAADAARKAAVSAGPSVAGVGAGIIVVAAIFDVFTLRQIFPAHRHTPCWPRFDAASGRQFLPTSRSFVYRASTHSSRMCSPHDQFIWPAGGFAAIPAARAKRFFYFGSAKCALSVAGPASPTASPESEF
jgi:hypothetical protein